MASKKRCCRVLALLFAAAMASPAGEQARRAAELTSLLPQVQGWKLTEAPRTYLPSTLFEYIDGAAESYLSYGFQGLAVGDYRSQKTPATVTAEIYDMGGNLNAFGIYSAERYPGSRYLDIGAQGYFEEGTLNFFCGPAYIKLMCFDAGNDAEAALAELARDIEKRVGDKGGLPPLLALFPRDGLVANSEKFVRQNVLGYGFLHDGYLADYRVSGQEFEVFLIAGGDAAEALKMQEKYIAAQAKNGTAAEKAGLVYHVRDRYAQNVLLAAKGRYFAGVTKLKDDGREVGMKCLNDLLAGLGD